MVRTPSEAGMTGIWMLLPDAGATVMSAVDTLACRVTSDDPRTADQRRADAVIQLALDALHGTNCGELPREHGMRPTIQVSVGLSTLLALIDYGRTTYREPKDLADHVIARDRTCRFPHCRRPSLPLRP